MVEREERRAHLLAGEIAAILHESGLEVERLTDHMFAAKSAKPLQDTTRLKLKFTREGWKHTPRIGRDDRGKEFTYTELTKPIIQNRGPKTHKDAKLVLVPYKRHVTLRLAVLGWFKHSQPGPLVSSNVMQLVAKELKRRREQQKSARPR